MASKQLLHRAFSSNISKLVRKNFSNTAFKSSTAAAYIYDVSAPAKAERNSKGLSDALAQKEKGPWTALSTEDKIAIYRAQFPESLIEGETKPSDLPIVIFGVAVLGTIAVSLWTFCKQNICAVIPDTFADDWKAEEKKKLEELHVFPLRDYRNMKNKSA